MLLYSGQKKRTRNTLRGAAFLLRVKPRRCPNEIYSALLAGHTLHSKTISGDIKKKKPWGPLIKEGLVLAKSPAVNQPGRFKMLYHRCDTGRVVECPGSILSQVTPTTQPQGGALQCPTPCRCKRLCQEGHLTLTRVPN